MSEFHLDDMFSGPTRITESNTSHLDVFLSILRICFQMLLDSHVVLVIITLFLGIILVEDLMLYLIIESSMLSVTVS